jgi:tRNA (mo5U34)-methyltransferase
VSADDAGALRKAVAERDWYHTIELPGGVRTAGHYDMPRTAPRVPLPPSLRGKRCLDVGTSDGFWAFEMERRGAEEVVALDIDDPGQYDWPDPRPPTTTRPANASVGVNENFVLARDALGSRVKRVDCGVYDASPERLGRFDFVFIGALLLHLRDPVKALAALRTVTDGELLSYDVISLWTTLTHPRRPAAALDGRGQPRWWTPNLVGHRRMLEAAGFEVLDHGGPFFMPFGEGFPPPSWRLRDLDVDRIAFQLTLRRLGAPCAWARGRPAV